MLSSPTEADADELDHLHEHGHKGQQAGYFGRDEDAEFEIERPAGTPRIYRWLIADKMCRSVAGLEKLLTGSTVLTVCGGSGMDAEFLASRGAHVITTDISKPTVLRALERGRRHKVSLAGVVADAEHLPFRDRSIDLVYVHDGLHHLADPTAGLREMARVARLAISITEPARAAVTRIAVRAGLAQEYEDAGNLVARLSALMVTEVLASSGFSTMSVSRYAMYYRHKPGRWSSGLSRRGLYQLAIASVKGGNKLLGRFGNKITVQAVRDTGHKA